MFSQKSANDGKILHKTTNYLQAIKANSEGTLLKMRESNSIYSDYGTAIYSNKLVFLAREYW
jgi:hypothetical protein